MRRILYLLLVAACGFVEGYKILAVFPTPSKSHVILSDGLVRHLLEAGHEITYITVAPKNNAPPNLRQIDVSDNMENDIQEDIIDLKAVINKESTFDFSNSVGMLIGLQNKTYNYPEVIKLLGDVNETFDVVIAEWMFSDTYCGFAAVFNVPMIWVSTVEPHWMILSIIDQYTNPSYTADIFSTEIPPFNFIGRVSQLAHQVFTTIVKNWYLVPQEREIFASLVPYIKKRGHEVPVYDEYRYKASLVIGNSHVSMGSAMPLPQSYKPVGGYHIDTNVKPLPKDLQDIMDKAKHGVILFSTGSVLKSETLPEVIKLDLLKMFRKLKQTVIWKLGDTLPGVPDNVHLVKWVPQTSILAHPNCVLFITHGGLLSTTEAIYYGVPLIGLPVFGDQPINVGRAVKMGYGRKVDFSYSLAEDLKEAIEEVLVNPSYNQKIKELSLIYHHRPVPPGKEIVHWVEHVIKTGGAPHLRSPALDVPFYQKYFLDLAALVLLVLVVLKTIVKLVLNLSRNKVDRVKKRN